MEDNNLHINVNEPHKELEKQLEENNAPSIVDTPIIDEKEPSREETGEDTAKPIARNIISNMPGKTKKTIIAIVAAVIIGIILFAVLYKPKVETANIYCKSYYLEGDSGTFSLEIVPENASIKNIEWTSSDENVISVTKSGSYKAVSPGTATIKVSFVSGNESFTEQATVQVFKQIEDVKIAGKWTMFKFSLNGSEKYSTASTVQINANRTGRIDIADTGHDFTWAYVRKEDDVYAYVADFGDGSSFVIAFSESKKVLLVNVQNSYCYYKK